MALRRPVVAVVDDDLRVLESLEDLLESAGHSVRLFSSATSLLENDNLAEIDCLVSDIGMPVVDGFKLRDLVQAARPELPVILTTGRHEIADEQHEIGQGYQSFFRKPFDGQALLAAITQALRTRPGDT
jgi:FixJ family two-component response regulator